MKLSPEQKAAIAAVTKAAATRANKLIAGVVQTKFPAKPEPEHCPKCDVRAVRKHAACGSKDF